MASIAIIIRAHGEIPINVNPINSYTVTNIFNGNIINIIDCKNYNIHKLVMVTLAKLGEVCYGDSNIDALITAARQMYTHKIGVSLNEKINQIFGTSACSQKVKNIKQQIFHSTNILKINEGNFTINKIYKWRDNNSSVKLFMSESLPDDMKTQINTVLENLSKKLTTVAITKLEIFDQLKQFNLRDLYFIDLTCNGYVNYMPDVSHLPIEMTNWISSVLNGHGIMGGTKCKSKLKKSIKIKKKKRSKSRKTKRKTKRKIR